MCRTLLCWLLICVASTTAHGQILTWDGNGAVPPDGVFGDPLNWNPNTVPGALNTTFFGVDATYTVTFDANHVGNTVSIFNGDVSWLSDSATIRTYMPAILAVGGGESLTIGSAALPMQVATGRVEIGTPATSNDGTVIVDGANSRLNATSTTQTNTIGGGSSRSGTLRYQNDAQGAFFNTLNIGSSNNDGSDGLLEVLSSAELIANNLNVGTSTSTATGTINVSGAGSTITQSTISTLTVGSATGGTGTINMSDNGTYTTGTGLTTVNATGTINRTGSGVFNVHGDLLLDGGQFLTPGGDYNHAAGKTITVQDGGLFNATPPNAGTNQNGAAGATLTTAGTVQVTDGTIRLNGGRGGNGSGFPVGVAFPGGQGGLLQVTADNFDLFGDALVTLDGGNGGTGDFNGIGGSGGAGGQIELSGGSATLRQDSKLFATGGRGGGPAGAGIPVGGLGGAGGSTVITSGMLTLMDDSELRIDGGVGGQPPFGERGVPGGMGGLVEIDGGVVTLDQNSLLSASGGRGGPGSQSNVSGNGGDGGEVRITNGTLTLNSGTVTTAGGAPGIVAFSGSSGSRGAPGQVNLTGGTFTINGGEVFTRSFTRSGGTFNFNDGKLTTSGGTFDIGAPGMVINGSAPAALPTLVLTAGATTPTLSDALTVGGNNRGRVELRGGSSLSTSVAQLGDAPGSEGQVLVDGAGSQWTVTGSGGFNVGFEGTGDLTVSGGGHVQVSSGSLRVGGSPSANGTVHVTSGSSLTANNQVTISDVGVAEVTVDGGGDFTAGSHIRVGGLAPFSAGTLNVSGAGSTIDAQASLNISGTPTSNNDGPGELNVSNNASVDVATTLRVWDGGTVNFSGGTLTADTIDHSLSGAFNFTGGTLSFRNFKGDLTQDGGLLAAESSPGASMNVIGDYTLNSGTLEIEVGGLTPGAPQERLFADTVTLGAGSVLDVISLTDTIDLNSTLEIITTTGGVTGVFDSVTIPTLNGLSAQVIYNPLSVELAVVLAGDYNDDGIVDAADYAVWRDNVGAAAGTLANDTNGGTIGTAHYETWKANFGASALALNSGNSSASNAVPEPVSLVSLAVMTLLALPPMRRHRV